MAYTYREQRYKQIARNEATLAAHYDEDLVRPRPTLRPGDTSEHIDYSLYLAAHPDTPLDQIAGTRSITHRDGTRLTEHWTVRPAGPSAIATLVNDTAEYLAEHPERLMLFEATQRDTARQLAHLAPRGTDGYVPSRYRGGESHD